MSTPPDTFAEEFTRRAEAVRELTELDREREAMQDETSTESTPGEPHAESEQEDSPAAFLSPLEVLRERADAPPRCLTGIPTIDRVTRDGGFGGGDRVTATGPPGSAKTALVTQIARTFAIRHGSPVVSVHADEGRDPAAIRVGQGFGVPREALEAGDPAALAALEVKIRGIRWEMPDPDTTRLEEAIARLFAMADEATGPPVLLVDTIQTVRSAAGDGERSAREIIEAREALLAAAKRRGALVLVCSEANRSSYASKDPEKRTDPLAAAAESRAVEYGSDFQIHMTASDQNGDLFEANVSKNRIGGLKPKFQLRLDKATATLAEVDPIAAHDTRAEEKKAEHTTKIVKLIETVETLLAKHPDGLTVSAILDRLGGRKENILEALNGLENQSAATWTEGPRNAHFWKLTRRP